MQPDIQLQLSTLHGISEPYTFYKNSTTIYLPDDLIRRLSYKPDPTPSSVVWKPRDQHYVLSDIVVPQLVGSASLPVLRVLRKTYTNEWEDLHFDSVFYFPLNREHISTIRISMLDEILYDAPVTESSYPTTVVLHFRRKQI
jgi:hypothetical protein